MKNTTKVMVVLVCLGFLGSSIALGAEVPKFKGVTIRMGAWETGGSRAVISLLPEFEKLTGIKVKMELMGDPVLQEKQYMDLVSGTAYYDVINLHYWYVTQYAEANLIQNLEPYLKDKKWEGYLDLADMLKAPLDMGIARGGNRYTLPLYQHASCTMYRKDLFSQFGIEVPKTMFDLREAARKLTSDTDGDGNIDIYGIAMRGISGSENPHMYWGWLSGWDGYVIDQKTYRPTVNSPQAVIALATYVDLLQHYGPPGASTWHYPPVEQIFESLKCAMILDATDFFPRIEAHDTVHGKTGYALLPLTPLGKRPNFAYSAQLGINSNSKHKDAAWAFIQWQLSPQIQLRTALIGIRGGLTSKKAWANPDYLRKYPFIPSIIEAMKISESNYIPKIAEITEIAEPVGIAFSEAISGMSTPKKALDKAAEKIEKILEKAGYYR